MPRRLALAPLLAKKSLFLWGPRQTGKSSLVRHELVADYSYDLLKSDMFLTLSREPWRLREEVTKPRALVVIDEVQKLPSLLDEVQYLIEERAARVLLTGSSARKLRRGGVNLLGGRARSRSLHPLVSAELAHVDYGLDRLLTFGGLPSIVTSDEPRADLKSYCADYLREEIANEGLTRNIPAFSRFLEVAALCNTQILNYSNISNDAQVARTTVHEYFSILRDTLIGYDLPPWGATTRRKPTATAKFYFFDIGVARQLQGRRDLDPQSPDYGVALEAWTHHELRAWNDYRDDGSLAFWRSSSGHEVDFVLDEHTAIEVKASRRVGKQDLKGLVALGEEVPLRRKLVVCFEARARHVDGIDIVPYRDFLTQLWAGAFT